MFSWILVTRVDCEWKTFSVFIKVTKLRFSRKLIIIHRFFLKKSEQEIIFYYIILKNYIFRSSVFFPNDPSVTESPSVQNLLWPSRNWTHFHSERGSTHARSSQIINTARCNKSIRQRGRPIVDRVVSFLTSVPPIVPWTIILPVESFLFLPLSLSFDPGYASSVHKLQRVSMTRKREQRDRVLALNETRNCFWKM